MYFFIWFQKEKYYNFCSCCSARYVLWSVETKYPVLKVGYMWSDEFVSVAFSAHDRLGHHEYSHYLHEDLVSIDCKSENVNNFDMVPVLDPFSSL